MISPKVESESYQRAIQMLRKGSVDLAVRKLEGLSADGDGHADAILGAIFEFGKGDIKPDARRALSYYERSVRLSASLQGWMGVGRIRLLGNDELRDYQTALGAFVRAAESSDYPQAWLSVAEMKMRGLGTPVDLDEAERSFRHAAELGNILGYTGLAAVAFRQGKLLSSLLFRFKAISKAVAAVSKHKGGGDALQRW